MSIKINKDVKITDIESETDIRTLVDKFYEKVIVDPEIGIIFTEIIELSWEKHIPIMYSFWSSLLLGIGSYTGNPMIKHIELNKIFPLKKSHFDRWILLWEETVNENFYGDISAQAIIKAGNIASIMQSKLNNS